MSAKTKTKSDVEREIGLAAWNFNQSFAKVVERGLFYPRRAVLDTGLGFPFAPSVEKKKPNPGSSPGRR
jgi:hypothetical protein